MPDWAVKQQTDNISRNMYYCNPCSVLMSIIGNLESVLLGG